MPIYEYQCGSCEYRFEVKQGFNDAPLTTCGRCGGAVTKLISAPAIMFKGDGWYVTDYSEKLKPPGPRPGSSEKPAAGQKEQKDKTREEGSCSGSCCRWSQCCFEFERRILIVERIVPPGSSFRGCQHRFRDGKSGASS